MSVYKRSLTYINPYRKFLYTGIFFNLLYSVFNVTALLFMMPVLKILFNQKDEKPIPEPKYDGNLSNIVNYLSDSYKYYLQHLAHTQGAEKVLLISCILFIIMFFLRNIFSYFSEFFLMNFRSGISRDFRIDLHNKVLELPVSYFSERRKGDIITRISSDVGEIEGNIFNGLVDIIQAPLMIIITMGTLFYLNYQLTLFTIIIFPLMGTIISLIGKSLKRDTGKVQNELGKVYSYMDESLSSLKIIKIFNADTQIKRRFDDTLNYVRRLSIQLMRKQALSSPVSELLGAITIGMIVYFGGRLSLSGNGLTGDAFVTYIGLFYTILDPIKKFSRCISNIQKGEVSAQRIFEVLDEPVLIRDLPGALSINEFNSNIEFKNVSFQYDDSRKILHNINLVIPKGKTVALVGQSGSGKSTMANLITRFWDIEEGEILIDGINIKNIKLKEYRNLFGLVTQESILFNDSIKNNIALGIDNPDIDRVKQAAKVANALEFIEKLPKEFESSVGESGGLLSGGQKQRLSIARAVMKNPPIMVMDEATSALDTESEKLVQIALDNLLEDRTSMVIAHRLSTIQKADLIVVMEEGRIIEQGTHYELTQKNGKYAKLVELQGFT